MCSFTSNALISNNHEKILFPSKLMNLLDVLFSWLPLYYTGKIFLILILLSTSGNNVLYRRIIQPKLTEHEKDIDYLINQTKKSSIVAMSQYKDMGIKYASELFLNTAVLGTKLLQHAKSTDMESRKKSLIEERDIDPALQKAKHLPARSYYEYDYESDAWEVPENRKSIRRPSGGSLRRLGEGKFKVRRGLRSMNFYKRSFYPNISSIKSRDRRVSEEHEKCSNDGTYCDDKYHSNGDGREKCSNEGTYCDDKYHSNGDITQKSINQKP